MITRKALTTTVDEALLARLRAETQMEDVPMNTVLERALAAYFATRDGRSLDTKQEVSVVSDHDQLDALLERGARLHSIASSPINGIEFVLVREVAR